MTSLTPKYLSILRFNQQDIQYMHQLGQYQGQEKLYMYQAPELLKSLQSIAVIESNESSNRIEGVEAPRDRIKDIVYKNATPQNRSEQEIAGYKDALDLIHESGKYMELSANILLQLHSLLNRYLPSDGGKWKMTDNEIVERDAEGEVVKVRFKAVSAVKTPVMMDDLTRQYHKAKREYDPLIVIPLTILDFLCIHPFMDGNGRTGRLLTLLLLYHFGFNVGRYISLERVIEESKESYYRALEESSVGWHDSEHNPFPWLNYFWGMMISAYKELEERARKFPKKKGK
ncbi:MAG: cell filamentation protein Fic, partial [Alphaproteobacteria bacterium]|nr:cell filamentation protein Fic [Alphaproteobacteria bacterium]